MDVKNFIRNHLFFLKIPNLIVGLFICLFGASHAQALDKVEIEVIQSSHLLYVSVGDYPRLNIQPHHVGKKIDISHMVGYGNNDVRLQAFNPTGSTTDYGFEINLLKNDIVVNSITCTGSATCVSNNAGTGSQTYSQDLYFDQSYTVNVTDAPYRQSLTISHNQLANNETASIYINDVYTGHSIGDGKTFQLPPGNYIVGLGVHAEENIYHPVSGVNKYLKEYTGSYYEEHLQLRNAAKNINFSQHTPLNVQTRARVGVVPVQTVNVTLNGNSQTYTLQTSHVNRLATMLDKTVSQYIEPITFGLHSWDVSFEPMVTNTVIQEVNYASDAALFIDQAGLTHLKDQYDIIIVYFASPQTGASAGSGFISLPIGFVQINPTITYPGNVVEETPLEVVVHEALHVYEQWQEVGNHLWKGIDGIHGAGFYGYKNERSVPTSEPLWNNPEWMDFYVAYMRGQLLELNEMKKDVLRQAIPTASNYDESLRRYIGVFDVMRQGLGNLHATPQLGTYKIRNRWWWENRYLSATNGVPGVEVSPTNWTGAHWDLEKNGNYFRLRQTSTTNQYLHVNESNHTQLMTSAIGSGAWSSHWQLQGQMGIYRLKNRWTGHYLHMENGAYTLSMGNPPGIYDWHSAQWFVEPADDFLVTAPDAGTYRLVNKWDKEKNLLNIGDKVAQVRNVSPGLATAQWHIETYGDYVRLRSQQHSNQYLHVNESSSKELMVSGIGSGAWSSHWTMSSVSGATGEYRLRNRWTGDYLYTNNGYPALMLGQPIDLMNLWSVRWFLDPYFANGATTPTAFNFRNKWHFESHLLNIGNGVPVVTSSATAPSTNQWILERYGSYFRIKNAGQANKYLHVGETSDSSLQLSNIAANAWSNQWIIRKSGGEYEIRNRWTGGYLSIDHDYSVLTLVYANDVQTRWGSKWKLETP